MFRTDIDLINDSIGLELMHESIYNDTHISDRKQTTIVVVGRGSSSNHNLMNALAERPDDSFAIHSIENDLDSINSFLEVDELESICMVMDQHQTILVGDDFLPYSQHDLSYLEDYMSEQEPVLEYEEDLPYETWNSINMKHSYSYKQYNHRPNLRDNKYTKYLTRQRR